MSAIIRPAKISDAPNIAEIYNHYIENDTSTFETSVLSVRQTADRIAAVAARHPYFVYENGGLVWGFCYAHPWKERAAYAATWEDSVYVHPHRRGEGIGGALLARLLEACRTQEECRVLIACITADNIPSIHLHKKFGFEKASHFREVGIKFGRTLDIEDYELILA